MKIYHGSTLVVDRPVILQNQRTLDFGQGFYTTSNRKQAEVWADKVMLRRNVTEKYLSVYEFDCEAAEKDLKILKYKTADRDWLRFVCGCRRNKPIIPDYDMVFGAVADDTVYSVIQLHELGIYDEDEAIKRLKVQKLFNQILFHTEKSLEYCKFIEAVRL